MIAVIKPAKILALAVKYNEAKVSCGKARFIMQNLQSSTDPPLKTVAEKIAFLQKRANLNKRVKVQVTHIFFNFEPKEKLTTEESKLLIKTYMVRIGFGNQPYFVYEHLDAAHPHFHIVTTPIDENGARIPLNNIIRFGSLKVTREMEVEFDLLRSQGTKEPGRYDFRERIMEGNLLEEAPAPPIEYGKETMGPAMNRSLNKVLGTYHFTSLEELNALLRPYNLKADRGLPGSATYLHRGLVYKVLDEEGKPIGKYIKASSLPGKPMLDYLEKRFAADLPEQREHARWMRNLVDWAVESGEFLEKLQEQGIELVWSNDLSRVVFVNHRTRWAISEQAMGEPYRAINLKWHLGLDHQAQIEAQWENNQLSNGFLRS